MPVREGGRIDEWGEGGSRRARLPCHIVWWCFDKRAGARTPDIGFNFVGASIDRDQRAISNVHAGVGCNLLVHALLCTHLQTGVERRSENEVPVDILRLLEARDTKLL